jgi:23S rRNA (cytosine1962-C5)-methyltransferase
MIGDRSPASAPPPAAVRVRLKPGRERFLESRHPWLFSGAIATESGPADAALARVESADGRRVATGLYSPGANLRVRLLGRGELAVDRALFRRRLEVAAALRRQVLPPATDGYRLVNAEGDELPGWTVDRFGDVLVSQITSAGLERLRDEAYGALAGLEPGVTILHLGSGAARRGEGLEAADVVVAGERPTEVRFREHGFELTAEVGGQKTGFYCDQRENRRRVESLAGGRDVLDLFAHTGAFSLYALRGGARTATAIESAPRLLDEARRAITRNGLELERAKLVAADVFEALRETSQAAAERYGVVVCDPPPLARRRARLDAAARAYKDVNRLALGAIEDGGYFLTFSCSAAVDGKLFRQILYAAAGEAGVALQLLEPLAAAPDHPVSIYHPEGEYLKGWLARVGGRLGS